MSNRNQQSAGVNPREMEEIEEGEIVESQNQDSGGEESDAAASQGDVAGTREIVAALPAMSIRERYVGGEDDDKDDQEGNAAATAAAIIVTAAAEAEAAAKGKGKKLKGKEIARGSGSKKAPGAKKRVSSVGDRTSGTGEAKPKRKAPELRNLPAGEPTCPICNRKFLSWKAAFGHQRAHKGREHRGLFPPPRFTPPSSPGRQSDDPAAAGSSGAVAGSSGASGSGGGGLGRFDLNTPPAEQSGDGGSGCVADFDLNKTPPKEDSDEGQI